MEDLEDAIKAKSDLKNTTIIALNDAHTALEDLDYDNLILSHVEHNDCSCDCEASKFHAKQLKHKNEMTALISKTEMCTKSIESINFTINTYNLYHPKIVDLYNGMMTIEKSNDLIGISKTIYKKTMFDALETVSNETVEVDRMVQSITVLEKELESLDIHKHFSYENFKRYQTLERKMVSTKHSVELKTEQFKVLQDKSRLFVDVAILEEYEIDTYDELIALKNENTLKLKELTTKLDANKELIVNFELYKSQLDVTINIINDLNKSINDDTVRLKLTVNLESDIQKISEEYTDLKILDEVLSKTILSKLTKSFLLSVKHEANIVLSELSEDYLIKGFNIDEKNFDIVIQNRHVESSDIKKLSSGEAAFIRFSITIAILKEMKLPMSLLLLDEIDATLHSSKKRKFIQKIIEFSNNNDFDTFVISHGEEHKSFTASTNAIIFNNDTSVHVDEDNIIAHI